ncbi:MAG: PD-(D/E)XK nuclease domain-containing protein [Clostridiales bacterium]|nr:PD-(D/E)XK nuclease domain-containing protein [Clostridiales bacterium]
MRELPSGKGFADLVFVPYKRYVEMPAMIIELKWDKSAYTAIEQIKGKDYVQGLKGYKGKVLLVGISYDKKSKQHQCVIEDVIRA